MKVVIAGGTGFLGREIVQHFEKSKHELVVLTRGQSQKVNKIKFVHWDAQSIGDWVSNLEQADVLINLSGKSINCRHTERNKTEIINSRIYSTRVLQSAINMLDEKPKLWINASAASIYGAYSDGLNTEESEIRGKDFSAKVAQKWEHAFFEEEKCRKVSLRISLILGKNGGALPALKKVVRFGMGGKLGSGAQQFGWIHLDDVIRMIDFIIANEKISGPVNCTAPNTPNNKQFMRAMRQTLNIPFGLPQPAFILNIGAYLIGTESELMLSSISAFPKKLIDNGFKFKFENY